MHTEYALAHYHDGAGEKAEGWRIRICDHCGPLMPKPVHRETRKSNDGLLLFLGEVALMALLGCAVCTAVVCRVMHEARQVETQQENRNG